MKSEKDKNPLCQIHSLLQINYNLLYFFPVEKTKTLTFLTRALPAQLLLFFSSLFFYRGGGGGSNPTI